MPHAVLVFQEMVSEVSDLNGQECFDFPEKFYVLSATMLCLWDQAKNCLHTIMCEYHWSYAFVYRHVPRAGLRRYSKQKKCLDFYL